MELIILDYTILYIILYMELEFCYSSFLSSIRKKLFFLYLVFKFEIIVSFIIIYFGVKKPLHYVSKYKIMGFLSFLCDANKN